MTGAPLWMHPGWPAVFAVLIVAAWVLARSGHRAYPVPLAALVALTIGLLP